MISSKEAANTAHKYLEDVLERKLCTEIEEIELDDTDQFWFITLRYWDPPLETGGIILPSSTPDRLKLFKVSRKDGEVVSMKVRIPN